MTAAEMQIEVAIADLVRSRTHDSIEVVDRKTAHVVGQMVPFVRKWAVKWFEGSRGSLQVDDLVQVGCLAVFKAVRSFDPEKKGTQRFSSWAFFHARREMADLVRTQSADVTVSDDAQRGRRGEVTMSVAVHSRDVRRGPSVEDETGPTEEVDEVGTCTLDTPESEYLAAERASAIRAAIRDLPEEYRRILRLIHGIGCERVSMRELAHKWGKPRSQLSITLRKAEDELARALGDLL